MSDVAIKWRFSHRKELLDMWCSLHVTGKFSFCEVNLLAVGQLVGCIACSHVDVVVNIHIAHLRTVYLRTIYLICSVLTNC